jgi:hypothetical protein
MISSERAWFNYCCANTRGFMRGQLLHHYFSVAMQSQLACCLGSVLYTIANSWCGVDRYPFLPLIMCSLLLLPLPASTPR